MDVRPIDADALSSLLFKRMGEYETLANDLPKHSYEGCVYYGKVTALYEAQLAIDRIIPTLDYAPVRHGEWLIHHYNDKTYEYEDVPYNQSSFENPSGTLFCSLCDAEALLNGHEEDVTSKYCPNCGAKMDGGKKDD